jgi:hypothetical protein
MRPLAAIGEVHWRTPEQVLLLAKIDAPVSPSTPLSLPLFMYQTTTSLVPSVVVEMGPVTAPESGAHHATLGFGGEPGAIRTDMMFSFPPPGQSAPEFVPKVT